MTHESPPPSACLHPSRRPTGPGARQLDDGTFRLLIDAAPDAMVVVDEQGRIVFVNLHTERMFGYTRGELIGQDDRDPAPERFQRSHVANRSRRFIASPKARPMGSGLELFGRRRTAASSRSRSASARWRPRGHPLLERHPRHRRPQAPGGRGATHEATSCGARWGELPGRVRRLRRAGSARALQQRVPALARRAGGRPRWSGGAMRRSSARASPRGCSPSAASLPAAFRAEDARLPRGAEWHAGSLHERRAAACARPSAARPRAGPCAPSGT